MWSQRSTSHKTFAAYPSHTLLLSASLLLSNLPFLDGLRQKGMRWVILRTRCWQSCVAALCETTDKSVRNALGKIIVIYWTCQDISTVSGPWFGVASQTFPDSKVHGANMGPIWGWQDPGGPHVGPMNFAIWVFLQFEIFVEPVTKFFFNRYCHSSGNVILDLFRGGGGGGGVTVHLFLHLWKFGHCKIIS